MLEEETDEMMEEMLMNPDLYRLEDNADDEEDEEEDDDDDDEY